MANGSGAGSDSSSSARTRPGRPVEVDLADLELAQDPAHLGHGPAGVPADVGERARPEGRQPAPDDLGPRRLRVEGREAARDDRLDRDPAVLAAHPRARRPAAGDETFEREREQEAGRDADRAFVLLADVEEHLGAQARLVLAELVGGRLAPRSEGLERARLDLGEPGDRVVGDPGIADLAQGAFALGGRDLRCRAGMDRRGHIGGKDEQRPAHAVHPEERPARVQIALHRRDLRVRDPGPAGQEHRDRIARMDAHDRPGHLGEVPGLRVRGQAVADDQTCAPLDGVDPLHVVCAAAGQGSAASAWIADAASRRGHIEDDVVVHVHVVVARRRRCT